MNFQIIRPERLYLRVAEQLLTFIDSDQVTVGDRLPSERDLAEQFGVSRPTIREAMIALELAGRVEIRSGSGVYVRNGRGVESTIFTDDAPGPLELLEARYFIEGDAAALAAERATQDDIDAIELAFQAMREENEQAELHETADERFHLLIAKAAGNSAIQGVVRQLWQQRRTSRMSIFFHEKMRERGIKPVIRDHRAILDAIRQRNPVAARQAMQVHLQGVIDVIVGDGDDAATGTTTG